MSNTSFSIEEIRKMITALRSDNKNERLHSISNLHFIARALGTVRTRNELLPYISETTDNSEEIWMIISEKLNYLIEEVGGSKEVGCILTLLKRVCEYEDNKVQRPALDTIISIGNKISQEDLSKIYLPLIKSWSDDMWHPLRSSSSDILCSLYYKFSDFDKLKLLSILPVLSTDSIILVRKNLIKSIIKLFSHKIDNQLIEILNKLILNLSSDESQAVLIEIPNLLSILPENFYEIKLNSSKLIFNSSKWQAKVALIESISKIFKENIPKDFILDLANKSSLDFSIEVRSSISRQLPYLYQSKCFEDDESFDQFLLLLSSDQNHHIKSFVGKSLGLIKNLSESILEKHLHLLLDDSDIQVKYSALESISLTGVCISLAIPYLSDIISLYNWRNRIHIAQLLPNLAKIVHQDFFSKNLINPLLILLSNESSNVRKSTIESLIKISLIYSKEWIILNIIPLIKKLFSSTDYQLREISIEIIFNLNLINECIDILNLAIKDIVPNVRIILARNSKKFGLTEIINKLINDNDPDVKFFL